METALLLVASESKRLDPGPDPLTAMLRFLVGIGVVFLAMWLLYRWAKRSSLGEYQGPGLRLISRLALSRSAQVAVVEIGGRMFLVGAGDSTVTPIAELYDTEEMATELETQAAAAAAARAETQGREAVKRPFGQVLAKFSRKAATNEAADKRPGGTIPGNPGRKTSVKRGSKPAGQASPTTASQEIVPLSKPVVRPRPEPSEPASITEAQMDALAAQIAAEFGGRPGGKP